MSYPEVDKDSKICVTVSRDDIKLYGNREAFRSLARWMEWLADSEKEEYYECHLKWHFQTYEAKESRELNTVWMAFDKDTFPVFTHPGKNETGTDVTFMAVEEEDLKKMEKFRSTGKLPEDWNVV